MSDAVSSLILKDEDLARSIQRLFSELRDKPYLRPLDLFVMLQARDNGQRYDAPALSRRVAKALGEIVAEQVDVGIDVIGD